MFRRNFFIVKRFNTKCACTVSQRKCSNLLYRLWQNLIKILSVHPLWCHVIELAVFQKYFESYIARIFQWLSNLGIFTETSTVPDQAVNSGEQVSIPSAIPRTVQRHILDSGKKSIKWRSSECLTVLLLYCFPLYEGFLFFLVESQDVHRGASEDQQLSLREYGGMRN
mgnify:CR=1 FL=1